MTDARRPQLAGEFRHQLEVPFALLLQAARRLEVARVGESVRADRPEVREPEQGAKVLAHVAARRALEQLDSEAHPARDDRDLQRAYRDATELGREQQGPLLRNDQQLPVTIVREAPAHGAGGPRPLDATRG